jgi:hypothetical protein
LIRLGEQNAPVRHEQHVLATLGRAGHDLPGNQRFARAGWSRETNCLHRAQGIGHTLDGVLVIVAEFQGGLWCHRYHSGCLPRTLDTTAVQWFRWRN